MSDQIVVNITCQIGYALCFNNNKMSFLKKVTWISVFFFNLGAFIFAPSRSRNFKNMKEIHNYKRNICVYSSKGKGNIYNDQHCTDFVHEPGLQPSFRNFTLCGL